VATSTRLNARQRLSANSSAPSLVVTSCPERSCTSEVRAFHWPYQPDPCAWSTSNTLQPD